MGYHGKWWTATKLLHTLMIFIGAINNIIVHVPDHLGGSVFFNRFLPQYQHTSERAYLSLVALFHFVTLIVVAHQSSGMSPMLEPEVLNLVRQV